MRSQSGPFNKRDIIPKLPKKKPNPYKRIERFDMIVSHEKTDNTLMENIIIYSISIARQAIFSESTWQSLSSLAIKLYSDYH